ncbi:DUF4277 domain-containing protein [Streptomyces sp. cg2]|uniref:DUF4277 domain-containing protein n=1 Tax=Streptomyces sp. cg2 TaxID=3238799 RepID=UPI0034E24D2B
MAALPVVADFCRRLDIAGIFDRLCPVREVARVSHGEVVEALIANRLTAPAPLEHIAAWAGEWAVEEVFGIEAETLNDDRIARALDAIAPEPEHITGSVGAAAITAFGPLCSDGFGDFFPDDPAAAPALSDGLVAALYAWAKSIDATLDLHLRDREAGRYDAQRERLFHEGAEPASRVAHEAGPARTVTHEGPAHGGLVALTSITWQGDRQL